jgi:hypothetical protein
LSEFRQVSDVSFVLLKNIIKRVDNMSSILNKKKQEEKD